MKKTLPRWAFLLMLLHGAMVKGDAPWEVSNDPVARLAQRLATGAEKLDVSSDKAFLAGVLRSLDVPEESQVLVFSKTSLQKALIGPARPRAIYYNEECYVGWVQGGDMELAGIDPERGPQYYLISRPFQPQTRPVAVTGNECLSCHAGGSLQVQSVHPSGGGYPLGGEDRFVTTVESPLSERWGGWYVTGAHGSERHMGNVVTVAGPKGPFLDRERGANVTSLKDFVATEPYLTSTSDIVALMVLEHQYAMHNTLAEAGHAVRRTLAMQKAGANASPAALKRVLHRQAEKVVSQLLFSGEYEWNPRQEPGEGVAGSAGFQETFRRNRREAGDGSSLKDFDLHTRLFKHRCSYMIDSASFEALPVSLKQAVYERLAVILAGRDPSPEFARLEAAERERIRRILLETKPEARAAWQD